LKKSAAGIYDCDTLISCQGKVAIAMPSVVPPRRAGEKPESGSNSAVGFCSIFSPQATANLNKQPQYNQHNPSASCVTLTGKRIARILFCIHEGTMVLLHGFVKQTRKTPDGDLALALKRKAEVER